MSEAESDADSVRQNALRQAELAFGPVKSEAKPDASPSVQTLEADAPPEENVAAEGERETGAPEGTVTGPRGMADMADDERPGEAPLEPVLDVAEPEDVEALEPEAIAEETAGISPASLAADDGSPSEEPER
jgi:hypothetical protein